MLHRRFSRFTGPALAGALPLLLSMTLFSACSKDGDGDGFSVAEGDCNDEDPSIHAQATEICDQKDNDCNGVADDAAIYYPDTDGDGYGATTGEQPGCTKPSGFVDKTGDCNDSDVTSFPGATEQCDGKDNNCDGQTDEGFALETYYFDGDLDGYGLSSDKKESCYQPDHYTSEEGDCDDEDGNVNPGEAELCNYKDDNCDGNTDEDAPTIEIYEDLDGDGFGKSDGVEGCAITDGYALLPGDCNDEDVTVGPTMIEQCDGKDNNCNGEVDENLRYTFFKDEDGDGFGDESKVVETCYASGNLVGARGDCDDANKDVFPGAADSSTDAKDTDCGGTSGPDISVSLSNSSTKIIKFALSTAKDGSTVWVGPVLPPADAYIDGDLSFAGKTLQLKSTHMAGNTIVDANGFSRTFIFDDGEGSGAVLDGFTIQGGKKDYGAGIYIGNSSPTIQNCIIRSNTATEDGGGMYLVNSNATILQCSILQNKAKARGAGMLLVSSSPTIQNCILAGNEVDLEKSDNPRGGAIAMVDSSPLIQFCTLAANVAAYGAGIHMEGSLSKPKIQNSILAYNLPTNIFIESSQGAPAPTLGYNDLFNPIGTGDYMPNPMGTNFVAEPGFMRFTNNGRFTDDDYHLRPNSAVKDKGNPAVKDSDGSKADLGTYGGPEGERAYYLDADKDGMFDGWEHLYGLDATSADDAATDLDDDGLDNLDELNASTRPDREDSDSDLALDGAEVTAGSSPTDWYSRPEAPGEVYVATVGEEGLDNIQDAVDMIQFEGAVAVPPGVYTENVSVLLKSLVLTKGAPIDPDSTDTEVVLSGATRDNLPLKANASILDISDITIQDGSVRGGAILTAVEGTLNNITFTENTADSGGAMVLRFSTPTISNSLFTDNTADIGGAIYFYRSEATLEACTFTGNYAPQGGALYILSSDPTLQDLSLEDNSAETGGAMYLDQAAPVVDGGVLDGNLSLLAGGVYATASAPSFTRTLFVANKAEDGTVFYFENSSTPTLQGSLITQNLNAETTTPGSALFARTNSRVSVTNSTFSENDGVDGGALRLDGATLSASNSLFLANIGTGKNGLTDGNGGAIYSKAATLELTNVAFLENLSLSYGGAVYLKDSVGFTLTSCLMSRNLTGFLGGGLYKVGSATGTVINSILAYNSPDNLLDEQKNIGISYTDLYLAPGSAGHNLTTLPATNLTTEPGFLSYSLEDGLPTNYHLALASSLINAGSQANASYQDMDSSANDLGIYGGKLGGTWDLDQDGFYDYFWPGAITDAPNGFTSGNYDCVPMDEDLHLCP